MKTAIVLSGGGSRGAYQIGVWKALRKLKIKYEIVTGTSVGALNGAMMVQNDYYAAINFWKNIDYTKIFDENFSNIDKNIYQKYIEGFITEGGLKPKNLEKSLSKLFDSQKFYSSSIDYGIVVYNLSKRKEKELTKKELKQTEIKDYILASAACFPAFKVKEINNFKYIDGGFYDNLPINLAIKMGADHIIAIDLKAIGVKRKIENVNKKITVIYPKNNIGSFLEFDPEIAKKNIKFGYNDTMKVFKKYEGNKFTFNKKIYDLIKNRQIKKYKKTLSQYSKFIKFQDKNFIESLEYLGKILNLDETKVYFLNYYNYKLKKEFRKISEIDKDLIFSKIKKHDIKSLLGTKYIVKYIYQTLKKGDNKETSLLLELFKKEFLAAIYLISIENE